MTYTRLRQMMLFIAVGLLLVVSVRAEEFTFKVKPGKPNEVKFISKAPLETIEGITNDISGSVTVDPANADLKTAGEFEVQMATIDTDNSIRNGHMRDNHLQTDKYPTSSFEMKSIEGLDDGMLPDGKPVNFRIKGQFTLHGVTKEISPEITALWNSTNKSLKVTAKFNVLLQDYDIPRPQFLFMKLAVEQKVEINFTAYAK